MVSQVNKLIYNCLCKGSDVYLPGIGSLVVRRTAASASSGTMAPPTRSVSFTGECRGESIIDVIVKAAGVDVTRAEEIYAGWKSCVTEGNVITMVGVGVLKGKNFTAEQMLLEKLNPAVTVVAPVKGKGGNNKKMIVAVIIVLIAGLLVGGAWWCVSNYTVEPAPMPEPEPVIEQPVVEPVPEVVVDPDVERMVEGGNYAVWGVFAEKANALKYKSMIERRYPHVKGTIYHHREDTMYLLALAQKSSRMACQNYIWDLQELDGLFDDMWVFTNK